MHTHAPNRRAVRSAAYLMMVAVAAFTVVCTAAQFWRTDLNWIAIPLSTYLTGAGSVYVQAVYEAMAIALLAFAPASYVATTPAQRTVLGSSLFFAAGAALPVVAVTELFRGTPYAARAQMMHMIASPATFLWLSFGMLLLSSRWRHDPHLRAGSRGGLALAWLATIVLWFQVLVSGLPNGLMEKLAIVLVLLWLAWAARQLARAA